MRSPLLVAALVALSATSALAEKPATTWLACNPNYYGRGRGGERIRYVVIHTIEGSARSGMNTFRYGERRVSAHYIVDFNGAITQMVKDQDTGWHAGRYNRQSIGIEHAGFAGRNNWTMAQYQASARLTRWICDTYGVPIDRQHIVGHKEVPGATHGDPGRFFDWDLYMRLVRECGAGETECRETSPVVQALRPGADQTVGADDTRGGDAARGWSGLLVKWSTGGGRAQQAARVLVEEQGGDLRYDSGSLAGTTTEHRVAAALQHGKGYRWRVRVWDGTNVVETPWTSFRTDFQGATIAQLTPEDGAVVRSTPALRWKYTDADGPQVSYRVWLDDDADHSRIMGDTKELNGARDYHHVLAHLKPNKTYYWRVMGFDGQGNTTVSGWRRFTTSSNFLDVSTPGLNVVPLSPGPNDVVPAGQRAVLRWAYHSGQRRDQKAFRIQIDDLRDDGRLLWDESWDSRATGYKARELRPGAYRWRVKVWDGQATKATDWKTFTVGGRAPNEGLSDLIAR